MKVYIPLPQVPSPLWKGKGESVYAFSQTNVDLLTYALKNRYDLHCTIHTTNRGPRIYINKYSLNILSPIILAHILPSPLTPYPFKEG